MDRRQSPAKKTSGGMELNEPSVRPEVDFYLVWYYYKEIMQRADASWKRDRRWAFKTEVSELLQSNFTGWEFSTIKSKAPPLNI